MVRRGLQRGGGVAALVLRRGCREGRRTRARQAEKESNQSKEENVITSGQWVRRLNVTSGRALKRRRMTGGCWIYETSAGETGEYPIFPI